MPVLVTYKFDGRANKKLKALSCLQHFLNYNTIGNFFSGQGRVNQKQTSKSEANSPILPDIKLVRNFNSVLITYKFDEDQIKMKELLCLQHFSGTQGQVTLQLVESGCNETLLRFYVWPGHLESLAKFQKIKVLLCWQHSPYYNYMGNFLALEGK